MITLLYLGYWSADDPLTKAVIGPRLEWLISSKRISRLVFCSIERGQMPKYEPPSGVEWIPLRSKQAINHLFSKAGDFLRFPRQLRKLVKTKSINIVVANSPLAGALFLRACPKMTVPFVVDCFEPHAEYMVESGVWRYNGLRFLLLKYFEEKEKREAFKLITVSTHYTKRLIREGTPEYRIETLANTVDLNHFRFSREQRARRREQLGFASNDTVGIYVGKFGGIYYEDEAFELFSRAFHFFGKNFGLILLTPQPLKVFDKLNDWKIDRSRIAIHFVPHVDVPSFLSAADFAFSTIKRSPCRKFCSPIKNGEYWANGLPILLEDGIGEDSDIIHAQGGGVLIDMKEPIVGFSKLQNLLQSGREVLAQSIEQLATEYRSRTLLKNTFEKLLNDIEKANPIT